MRVHLPHIEELDLAAPKSTVGIFKQLAERGKDRHHSVVEDPSLADAILFTECHLVDTGLGDWRLSRIRNHELRRAHPERCYVYDERDRPWSAMPGLYVSLSRRSIIPRYQVSSPYCSSWRVASRNGSLSDPKLLFSFVGSPTAGIREEIYLLRHPRAVIERVENFNFCNPSSERFTERRLRFGEVIGASKFVLCPRGNGTASMRLYETLAAGRVPVILADDWIPPRGPPWADFCIRWPEHRVQQLPVALENAEGSWADMAKAARSAFRTWFAADVLFDRLIDGLEPLVKMGAGGRFPRSGVRRTASPHVALTIANRVKHSRKRFGGS